MNSFVLISDITQTKMFRKHNQFFWSILIVLQVCSSFASPANINYPDSYEMYSYKEPRSMNDLKHQHVRQAMIDVTDTINEVQKILQKDPRLPRLTRGELEDLFEMVTREEYKRSLAAGDFERAKHMRSLMLVLPFNTNNYSEERLEVKKAATFAIHSINTHGFFSSSHIYRSSLLKHQLQKWSILCPKRQSRNKSFYQRQPRIQFSI